MGSVVQLQGFPRAHRASYSPMEPQRAARANASLSSLPSADTVLNRNEYTSGAVAAFGPPGFPFSFFAWRACTGIKTTAKNTRIQYSAN